MKATLTFDDSAELRLALDASRWRNAMRDLDEWLRQQAKHGTLREVEWETMRAQLRVSMVDNEVSFDD